MSQSVTTKVMDNNRPRLSRLRVVHSQSQRVVTETEEQREGRLSASQQSRLATETDEQQEVRLKSFSASQQLRLGTDG